MDKEEQEKIAEGLRLLADEIEKGNYAFVRCVRQPFLNHIGEEQGAAVYRHSAHTAIMLCLTKFDDQ